MEALVALAVIALLGFVVWLVGGPLRAGAARLEHRESAERQQLEAAKEAKLREIRELELDWRTGKLSDEDYRALDRRLRGEAVDVLRRLDELG